MTEETKIRRNVVAVLGGALVLLFAAVGFTWLQALFLVLGLALFQIVEEFFVQVVIGVVNVRRKRSGHVSG